MNPVVLDQELERSVYTQVYFKYIQINTEGIIDMSVSMYTQSTRTTNNQDLDSKCHSLMKGIVLQRKG